ncbi:hypothetical protein D9M69_591500 [compost metagenome]
MAPKRSLISKYPTMALSHAIAAFSSAVDALRRALTLCVTLSTCALVCASLWLLAAAAMALAVATCSDLRAPIPFRTSMMSVGAVLMMRQAAGIVVRSPPAGPM